MTDNSTKKELDEIIELLKDIKTGLFALDRFGRGRAAIERKNEK